MKKTIYSLRILLSTLFVAMFGMVLSAQVDVQMTWTPGAFAGEPGFEVINTNTNAVIYCEAAGGVAPASATLNLAAGVPYEVRGFDSYGDGWNGGNLSFTQAGFPLFSTNGPPNAGFSPYTNTCNGIPSPVTAPSAAILGTFEAILVTCEINCVAEVNATTQFGLSCAAFVDIPVPELIDCEAGLEILFEENFDACAQPAGWTTSHPAAPCTTGFVSFDCTNVNGIFGVQNPDFSGCIAMLDDDAIISFLDVIMITSPAIDVSAGNATLSLDYTVETLFAGNAWLEGWDGASWVMIHAFGYASEYGHLNIDLSAFTNADFQFRAVYDDEDNWAYGLAFDNVVVSAPSNFAPVAINDYNGTTNASDFYGAGVTVVTWSLTTAEGFPVTCETVVTVEDLTPPVFTPCPDDIVVTLDPGDCVYYFSQLIEAEDDCPAAAFSYSDNVSNVLGQGIACATWAIGDVLDNVYYKVYDGSAFQGGNVEAIDIMIDPLFNAGDMNVYFHSLDAFNCGAPPATFDPSQLTLLGGETVQVTSAGINNLVLANPVSIPSSASFVVFEIQLGGAITGDFAVGMNTAGAVDCASPVYLQAAACGANVPTNLVNLGLNELPIISFSISTPGVIINQTGGGGVFEDNVITETLGIGVHSYEFTAIDANGNETICAFTVTINDFPNPIEFLVCNDLVNVSLGADCTALITADMLLEGGPYSCYDNYTVTLAYDMNFTNIIPNATLNGNHVGLTVFGRVENEDLSNSCWSQLFVEDKIPPFIECRDIEIACDDPLPTEPAPESTTGGSVATITDGGNGGAVGGMVYFDVTNLTATDLILTGFDMNITANTLVDVYTKSGTYAGNEANAGAWTFAGQVDATTGAVSGPFPGNGTLTPATGGSVSIAPGVNGIALEALDAAHNYTNGNGANQSFSDAFISVDLGSASNTPFSAAFTPRVFNGAVHYLQPLPQIVPSDACGPVELTFTDVETLMNCQTTPYVKSIERTWTATDGSGNSTTCTQTISVLKPDLSTITLPPNYDGLDLPALLCDGAWDTNGNGYPDPAETGAPGLVCDEIVGTHEDLVIDICEGTYKILRNWTILDWCTGEIITHTQLIKVSDENGPEITCPEDFTVNTGYYDCGADVIIPAPVAIYDACSGASAGYTVTVDNGTVYWNGAYYILQDVVMDGCATDITVTYTASDDCGNEGTCEMIVTIRDEVPPVALCDQMTNVTLGADGTALVYWTSLDDGSYDNCGVDRIQVRRVETPPSKNVCGLRADIWRDYVKFCCDDLDENVMVEVGVWDNCNNFNSCWVTVFVESKLAPTIVPPPNITISCDFQFDLWDLSVFGEVETEQTLADGAVIDDIYTDDYEYFSKCLNGQGTNPIYWGQDGFAYGVCDVEVVENYNENLECGTGVITRVFKATSGSKSKTAVQKITIIDCDPFTENDIVWPRDYTSSSCYAVGPHHGPLPDDLPTVNGWPRYLDEDNCSLIAATFEDQVFQFVDSACWKVLRTWTVIDWCQYESNDPFTSGYWQYTQVIKLKNTVRPAFDPCEDMLVCTDNVQECTGYVELPSNVTDDCTPYESLEISWKVDAFADGTYDIFSTQPGMTYDDASGYYPFGTHRIFWNVEDMCGNTNTCSFLFTVEDCKQPTPYCYNGLAIVVMPAMGTVDVYARDFDVGSFDNCCANDDLVFRMIRSAENPNNVLPAEDNNPATPYPAGMTLTCDDVADVSTVVQIWVGDCGKDRNLNGVIEDNERNWDYCETYILAQDPNDVCPDTNGISGIIEAIELSTGIENATVMIENTQSGLPPYLTTATDAQGSYHATGLPIGEDAIITTEKNDDYLNGVNVLDLVLIQQHILGLAELNSNEKLIAADANNSNSISALDIIDLRKLILGIYDELPGNDSWVFPGNNVEMTIANGMYTQDFGGIKIGDVNETVQPSSLYVTEDRTNGTLTFSIDEMSVVAGEEYAIPVSAANFSDILGYQFTFGLNGLELINVEGGTIDMGADNFGTHRMNEGLVSTVWNSFEPVSANDVLFTLNVVATQSGQISSMINANSRITTEGAYSQSNGALGIDIQFNNAANADYALYQNTPNPFNEGTKVTFTMAAAADATLTVYDVTGKVLVVRELDAKKGYNEVSFTSEDLNAVGVLYYQLDTDDFSATKKMIKLQ